MSDAPDDPLLGLLTDIAEGVAALIARVDAIESRMDAQNDFVNESLTTIAEIATRTYYVSNPPKALPDAVINTAVMEDMIERWPTHWSMTFPPSEFKVFNNLHALSVEEIEAHLRARANLAEDVTNAQRLRHERALVMLNEEMDRRFKAHEKSQERGGRGR
jgi:hypothetical protein